MDEYDPTLGNTADWKHWTWEANRAAREAEDELERTVVAAKKAGCTWQELGDAMEMSRQAVQQRFGLAVYGLPKGDDL